MYAIKRNSGCGFLKAQIFCLLYLVNVLDGNCEKTKHVVLFLYDVDHLLKQLQRFREKLKLMDNSQ